MYARPALECVWKPWAAVFHCLAALQNLAPGPRVAGGQGVPHGPTTRLPNKRLWSLIALLASASVCPAHASEALRKQIHEGLALPIQKLLENEGQPTIAVGEFTGPAQLDSNGGPGLQQILTEELLALKAPVAIDAAARRQAKLSVKGDYALVDDPDRRGFEIVLVTADVRNDRQKTIQTFSARLDHTDDITHVLGITVALPPADEAGAGKKRGRELDSRAKNPAVHVDGSQVSASANSNFAVEVLVKARPEDAAQPRAAREAGGLAFVNIKRGEIYALRLHNRSGAEVAAAITIDGIDVFAFSEVRDAKTGRPSYTHYIIGPTQTADIVGWHLRDKPPDNYASFLVTEYGKGASARIAAPAKGAQGVITVTFSPSLRGKPRSSADETGLGPPVSVDVKPVQRSIGRVIEAVSIRYTR